MALTRIGLAGLAVMGQNLALNIAEKGFPISVYNRTTSKVDETVQRAKLEGNLPLYGFHDPASFVNSIQKPRVVIMLVKAGAPVDQTIATLAAHLEQGDCIVDGGNEWYENTKRREKAMEERGLLYLGMGVSGGEEDILLKVSAQIPDSGPCVTYIGNGGSGNFVKMVHNGIEYGDMQLIAEAYDVLKSVGKLTNGELQQVFAEWNKGELLSFLVEITADIFSIKDDQGEGYLVDKVLDKTGMKGTGKWTVQQAAELSVAAPTIEASLDSRFLSGLKDERVAASKIFQGDYSSGETVDKAQLIEDVRKALYASKICSYAQGMNIIKAKSTEKGWGLNLGELARIWKGGCIIRASFLDRIKKAYDRNGELANLLIDPEFAQEIMDRQAAWRRVVCLAINNGVSTPGMSTSLAYFDSYRRDRQFFLVQLGAKSRLHQKSRGKRYKMALTRIGLAGLAVMGQNLALNIAEKGFPISVYNRTTSKVDETVQRAKLEGNLPLYGFHDPASFVNSIQKPRVVIMLVKAGAPVDQTIATLAAHLEQGDCIVDGGNEWFLSGLKDERVAASKIFQGDYSSGETVDKAQLIEDVRKALYASKICSYAQGMNIIKAKSTEKGWGLNLGELARIWKGGCIIRASFLDRIKKAYDRNGELANLLIDPEFAQEIMDRQAAWRRVVCLAINNGVSTPGMSASLAYFDSYRRDRLPANLVQAQRDYFGAHTYERVDMPGSFHTEWYKIANSKI
ncbi:unnamed protein product [Triticum turgidum subsp. durum]|uniref:phosphogluconate dehydrogenase (NADP(+)-dependent, decarboxylating) n=2 Tax=Triticum TaxID=4564 RepID=A0A9R0Z0A3_TRITD|nr:unnamed protein product [Triticum turgidum subsp. durum]